MNYVENLRSSLISIFSHKFRSFLTLLGIFIGVISVITMFSSVAGIKSYINEQFKNLGFNNSIIVSSGSSEYFGRRRRIFSFKRKEIPISFEDYDLLSKSVEHLHMYGMIETWQRFNKNNNSNWLRLIATNNDFFVSKTYPVRKGRYFNNFEMNNYKKVCIIGSNFAKRYYNDDNIIGKFIKVGKNNYKIIGVLAEDVLNSKSGMNFNTWERRRDLRAVYIPLKTGVRYLRNNISIDYFFIQSKDSASFNPMINQIRQFFLMRHNMAHDITIKDIGSEMIKITKQLNDIMKKWNITLIAIASISLFVGGIGLFSTLLISISERMSEIGIRKTIGSTDLQIFMYFINESIVLAMIASTLGILFSTIILTLFSHLTHFDIPISSKGIFLGLGFSLLIGLLSGIYPAYKASKINPIEAIYYYE